MKIECQQLTTEWMMARHGKPTGSRIADVIDFLKKGGESAARRNYKIQLVAETLTGLCEDSYVSPEMEWGNEQEPFARALYEIRNDVSVEQVGFYTHPTIERSGASPDGLIGEDGMIQIKCPKTSTHIKWMLDGVVPEEHEPQMVWEMACAERQWSQFVSYDPRLPDHLRLFTPPRLERNPERVAEMEAQVLQFLSEMDALLERLGENSL